MKTVIITQSLSDLKNVKNRKKYSPAFEFYIKKLNRGNKFPRGKYFKNKIAGYHPIFMDEFWMNTNHSFMDEAYKLARAF